MVIDSSAFLAYVNGEPGGEAVLDLLPDVLLSSVNAAEIATKTPNDGLSIG